MHKNRLNYKKKWNKSVKLIGIPIVIKVIDLLIFYLFNL